MTLTNATPPPLQERSTGSPPTLELYSEDLTRRQRLAACCLLASTLSEVEPYKHFFYGHQAILEFSV